MTAPTEQSWLVHFNKMTATTKCLWLVHLNKVTAPKVGSPPRSIWAVTFSNHNVLYKMTAPAACSWPAMGHQCPLYFNGTEAIPHLWPVYFTTPQTPLLARLFTKQPVSTLRIFRGNTLRRALYLVIKTTATWIQNGDIKNNWFLCSKKERISCPAEHERPWVHQPHPRACEMEKKTTMYSTRLPTLIIY